MKGQENTWNKNMLNSSVSKEIKMKVTDLFLWNTWWLRLMGTLIHRWSELILIKTLWAAN